MKISEAIRKRILYYCDKENLSINKLANKSIITQSTLNNIINQNSKNTKLLTIVRICDGLGIKVKDFFDDPIFDNIDRED